MSHLCHSQPALMGFAEESKFIALLCPPDGNEPSRRKSNAQGPVCSSRHSRDGFGGNREELSHGARDNNQNHAERRPAACVPASHEVPAFSTENSSEEITKPTVSGFFGGR